MESVMYFYYGMPAIEWLKAVKAGWMTDTSFYEQACAKFGYRNQL